jgi:predicted ATPase
MITKIRITGYKTLHDCTVDLGKVTVFIGDNMSGKSNLINAIEQFATYLLNPEVTPEGESALVRSLSENQHSMSVFLHGTNSQRTYWLNWAFDVFYRQNNPDWLSPVAFTGSWQEHRQGRWRDFSRDMAKTDFSPILCYKDMDVSANAAVRKPQSVAPFHYLKGDGSNLINVLIRYFNDDTFRSEVKKIMKFVNPDFEDIYIESVVGNYVNLTWKEKYLSRDLYASDLSDGTLRLLCLCAILLPNKFAPPPKLICIDEPELGVHPKKILPLIAEMIKNMSEESQLIMTTHSPELLNHFSLDDIITVQRMNGKTILERPRDKNHLKVIVENYEQSLGDLWLEGELGDTRVKV